MASEALGIRERLSAAAGQIRRVKRLDRFATWLITLGGILIVACVSLIFVFILGEALPLFRGAQLERLATVELATAEPGAQPAAAEPALVLGSDEYARYVYRLLPDGRLLVNAVKDGARRPGFRLAELEDGARLVAGSRSLTGDYVAGASEDGRVFLGQVRFRPRYTEEGLEDIDIELRPRGELQLGTGGRPLRALSYLEEDGIAVVAALVGANEVRLVRVDRDDESEARHTLRAREGDRLAHLRLGKLETLAAASDQGRLYHWELVPEPRLTDVVKAADRAVTALDWALGGISILVGDERGRVSGWFRARGDDDALALVRAHELEPQAAAITRIAPSPRDKSFASLDAAGGLMLRHLTSERVLVERPQASLAQGPLILAPRADNLLSLAPDGALRRFSVENPHPEVSFGALFGEVWYEGYGQPEHVWQSTGATNDFEPKLSLVPLVFGTIKATVYAMLFAVPLAILGALYTSQFVHPSLKAQIKPVVEIMAALPSVVIGFVAGLWLASRVERHVVPVLLMVVLLPAFGTAGVLLWNRLPRKRLRALRPGAELLLILPLLLVGGGVALVVGPGVEAALFGGDFRHWLYESWDTVYDQRNSVVVGLAMGFAVIPIIFTISEDAFSSVPAHLTAASLALGASRWQTAVRVVLPTASPGIFSAVMIGFGRAVGETMIVLMATGNTPLLDWSIFNGMRTLSANIAVEIPEAPHGATLYRVLFLSGGVLFLMTFAVNTVAELIRQRLRERYRAL